MPYPRRKRPASAPAAGAAVMLCRSSGAAVASSAGTPFVFGDPSGPCSMVAMLWGKPVQPENRAPTSGHSLRPRRKPPGAIPLIICLYVKVANPPLLYKRELLLSGSNSRSFGLRKRWMLDTVYVRAGFKPAFRTVPWQNRTLGWPRPEQPRPHHTQSGGSGSRPLEVNRGGRHPRGQVYRWGADFDRNPRSGPQCRSYGPPRWPALPSFSGGL